MSNQATQLGVSPLLTAILNEEEQNVSGLNLITTEEAARLLRRDPSTLRRWRTARPLQGPPFIRLTGRVTLYNIEDLRTWLAGRRIDADAA